MKIVGIIGAGAAGLCAAHHVSSTAGMIPVVWEKSLQVGGTWVYTSQVGKDEHGLPIHSSMYKNMKTNLPKEVMCFPDYPFEAQEESFLHHTQVCKYLESYTKHYNLQPYIKFGELVERVTPVLKNEGAPSWSVAVKHLATNKLSTTICDALLVCNGHYSVPKIPSVEGIENYKGHQIHSHDYREPSPFRGSTVVVLGAGPSGLDISLEVSTVAHKVLLSHNRPPLTCELPGNVCQVRGVVSATDNGFVFDDGTSVKADVIMYCTGYEFTFPFLTPECGISIENNIIKPLYKHMINTTYPSMAFIGIPFQICPFPLFDFQVQLFVKMVSGVVDIPTKMEMDEDTRKKFEAHCSKNLPERHFHTLGKLQWQYDDDLADMGKISRLPHVVPKLYEKVREVRLASLMHYKTTRFVVTGPESFELIA